MNNDTNTHTKQTESNQIDFGPIQDDQLIKRFDVVDLPSLVTILRQKLKSKETNIVILADSIGCSKSFLYDFRNGKAVCMDILNRLANHFRVKYVITNFDPKDLSGIAWTFPGERDKQDTLN